MRAVSRLATAASRTLKQKSADPWKYHTGDKSAFWNKFRRAMVLNPDSTSGNPITGQHRYPPPASREEVYSLPPSKASDAAQNTYFERDFRRQYPRLDVVTQGELSALLLNQPEGLGLPAPGNAPAQRVPDTNTDVATIAASAPPLSSLYYSGSASSSTPSTFYSASRQPPLPASGLKLEWSPSPDKVQPDPYTYFPMENYSSKVAQRAVVSDHDTERTGKSTLKP